jgi:predicted nucleotidyltransferase component of viral defense system
MLHTRTVRPELLGLLKQLMAEDALREFTLVGGTALALQMGHRFSEDIDMFCFGDLESLALQKLLN